MKKAALVWVRLNCKASVGWGLAPDDGYRISPTRMRRPSTANHPAQARAKPYEGHKMDYGNPTLAATTEASEQAQRTAGAAAEAVNGAKRTANAAIEAGRAYATTAVNAAGRTYDEAKGHVNRLTDQTSRYVVDQPMRAVGIAAAAGFLVAVLLNGLRSRP